MHRRIVSTVTVVIIALALVWPGGATNPTSPAFQMSHPYAVHTLAPEAFVPAGAGVATTQAPDTQAAPVLETNEPSTVRDDQAAMLVEQQLALLQAELAELTAAYGGQWGIVYEELAPLAGERARLAINEHERFYAASTTKLPIVLCLYEQAAKGQLQLDETMQYLPEDYWDGAGMLRFEEPGGTYRLRELAELAIRQSDNVAWIMLERRLGYDAIDACMTWFGGDVADIVANETTPHDMAAYLQAVLRLQEREPELGRELVDFLATTYYRHRIPAGLPPGIAVANKTGTWPETNGDVAIVYLPGHPYVLTVFVEGIPEPTANEAIPAVATIVHRAAAVRAAALAAQCRGDEEQVGSCRAIGQ